MYICVCATESLCCTAKTGTILYINYTSIFLIQKINKMKDTKIKHSQVNFYSNQKVYHVYIYGIDHTLYMWDTHTYVGYTTHTHIYRWDISYPIYMGYPSV